MTTDLPTRLTTAMIESRGPDDHELLTQLHLTRHDGEPGWLDRLAAWRRTSAEQVLQDVRHVAERHPAIADILETLA